MYYYATELHEHVTAENYVNGKFNGPYKTTKQLNIGDFVPSMYDIKIR